MIVEEFAAIPLQNYILLLETIGIIMTRVLYAVTISRNEGTSSTERLARAFARARYASHACPRRQICLANQSHPCAFANA